MIVKMPHLGPRPKKTARNLLIFIVMLVALRMTLPIGVKWYVDCVLADIPGYHGRIDDIDIALWRGSYEIQGLDFVKLNGKVRDPLFSADVARRVWIKNGKPRSRSSIPLRSTNSRPTGLAGV